MSAPPHSIEPFSPTVESDRFSERNNFLMLLLGLVSVAEQVLSLVPNLGLEEMPDTGAKRPASKMRPDATSILR